MSAFYVVMNKEKWAAISPENQKIIEKLNVEYMDKHDRTWDEINESGKTFFLKLGGKMIPLSKAESDRWAKAVEPVLDDYVKMTKEKGLPGDQVLKFVQDFLKKNQ
jgi:TRAP-type transport system periplasmic protein